MESHTDQPQPSGFRKFTKEWLSAIVFAVVVASLVRGLFMQAFAIPTGSMENSLLVGDQLFVSKVHYGAKLPETLLQIPLMHQTMPGTDIPAYLDWVQLPKYRLPGFTQVQHNDPVVFNYPPEWDRPVDMKTFYVKRCVGLPGDTLQIVNKQIMINGQALALPENAQTSYFAATDQQIHPRIFRKLNIDDYRQVPGGYKINMEAYQVADMQKLDFIQSVEEITYEPGSMGNAVYPHDASLNWTTDFYGPVYLPKAGATIPINPYNIRLYGSAIIHYEPVNATIKDDKLLIDGKEQTQYTFQQDYYFMMGDNRHNSEDSRFWGFVPGDHIVGKPLFVYFSTDKDADLLHTIRWNRFFTAIH